MLSLTLTSSSLLLLPLISNNPWLLTIISLILILVISLFTILPSSSLIMVSSWMANDLTASTLTSLTIWITAMMLIASYKIYHRKFLSSQFLNTCIALMIILILCFNSTNMFHFYIWFEASLIPTAALIMIWGYQPERIQASMYLMIYTVVASLPLLVILCKVNTVSYHANMAYPELLFPTSVIPTVGWLLMITAFMVKLPLFSVHLWLPKAHVEAPVAGSMILAAILLKLGGYGLVRMSMLFPYMMQTLYAPLSSIALIGAVLTGMICMRQSDLKSMIAYSSVGHMGLMIAGIMSNTATGMFGGLAMMIAHGLVSSALFCLANITYEMTHTRSLALTRGLLTCMPILSMWWFLLICANMAAPPSINLMSEILLIIATISHNSVLAIPLMLISFITAAYSLYLFSAINHGSPILVSNPLSTLSSHYYLLMSMHLAPVLLLILAPDIISNMC